MHGSMVDQRFQRNEVFHICVIFSLNQFKLDLNARLEPIYQYGHIGLIYHTLDFLLVSIIDDISAHFPLIIIGSL